MLFRSSVNEVRRKSFCAIRHKCNSHREHCLSYAPYTRVPREFKYEGGEPVILTKSMNGALNKLITREALKKAHAEVISKFTPERKSEA